MQQLNEMLSSDQIQVKIMSATNEEEKLKFLTSVINDPATNGDLKTKCRQLRVGINYECKRWQEVLKDIDILEQTNDCGSLNILKIKAGFQEYCRKTRLIILEKMHNGNHDDEYETLLLNISQKNIDELIDGHMQTKRSRSTVKRNK